MANRHLFVAVNFIFIVVQICEISAQGEPCYTPNNSFGICVVLPQCPSLVNFFGQFKNDPRIINYLLISQRNCGTRSLRGNPLVCCNDPVINRPQERPFENEFTEESSIPSEVTTPTVPTTRQTTSRITFPTIPQTTSRITYTTVPQTTTARTTPTTTTTTRTEDSRVELANDSCYDPNGVQGVCKNIKECPAILSEFIAKSKDTAYIRYIKQSNKKCHDMPPYICCPFEKTSNNVTPSIQGRLLTPEEGCGSSNATVRRIVGGVPAKAGDFPWMALIGYINNLGDQSFKCGGSLITTRHVLTAAHCILSTLSFVRLGEHDISSTSDGDIEDIDVIRSERHPNYNKRDGTYDIAVLYLERDVDLSKRINTICLPVSEPIRTRNFVDYQPFVAGWGRLQEGGKSSNVLQQLQVPVLDNAECKEQYRKQGKLISENQFGDVVLCAGHLQGGKDSCQGDSGGPLMQPVYNDHAKQHLYYQIGIVSYGIGCARTNTPGVYSSVQHFVDWIQEQIMK